MIDLNMVELVKRYWDAILSYIFIFVLMSLVIVVRTTCAGAGCMFGLNLVVLFLMLSFAFIIVGIKKIRYAIGNEIKIRQLLFLAAIVIDASIVFFVFHSAF